MPSAKTARVSERKRKKNMPLRTKAKSTISTARGLISASEIDAAEKAVKDAVIALDKAAQKGAIHKKNASRRKSRIMKTLHKAKSA